MAATRTARKRKHDQSAEHVFGRGVEKRRRERDLSQKDLADRLGELGRPLHQTAVAKIESSVRGVSLEEALLLGVALDAAPAYLMSGEPVRLTPKLTITGPQLCAFVSGKKQLEGMDEQAYRNAVSPEQWRIEREPGVSVLAGLVDEFRAATAADDLAQMDDILVAVADAARLVQRDVKRRRAARAIERIPALAAKRRRGKGDGSDAS